MNKTDNRAYARGPAAYLFESESNIQYNNKRGKKLNYYAFYKKLATGGRIYIV